MHPMRDGRVGPCLLVGAFEGGDSSNSGNLGEEVNLPKVAKRKVQWSCESLGHKSGRSL